MIIDTEFKQGKLIVSYVAKDGNIKFKNYPWANPKKFITCDSTDKDKHPKYKSWEGKPVKEVPSGYPNRYSIYDFIDALPESEKAEIFEYNEPKMYFVDIETEYNEENGYSSPAQADNKVLSISIVYDDKIILLGLKDMPEDMQKRIIDKTNVYFEKFKVKYKFKYVKYADEFSMMYDFFYRFVKTMPIISGWNFVSYDWVYLVNRAKKISKVVEGKERFLKPEVSSPTNKLNTIWMSDIQLPMHRMVFDYMQLYEICDTSVKVKESSGLDFVSEKLLGVNKIKYSGSLQKLYDTDFETFMYYNAVDSILVQQIHNKTNYISIIFAISVLAQIKVSDVISHQNNALASLAITEGVLRNRFRNQENIVLFKDSGFSGDDQPQALAGGWVKDPAVGMNRWVATYDFSSLYPTTQRMFYIAPELYLGRQDTLEKTCYRDKNSDLQTISPEEHVVMVNGCVFAKRNSPTLQMLTDVFADRKKNKKIMQQKKEKIKELQNKLKELEEENV